MPYSSEVFNKQIERVLRYIRPNVCLDVGAGAGKYGHLLRGCCPTCKSIGVEIESDYVDKFKLAQIYDEVRCIDAVDLINTAVEETFDLVIFGDCLEHLRKSSGLDLLNFLVYRCAYILVLYPERYLQNSVDGYIREAHISVWCELDFRCFTHTPIARKNGQRLVVLQGYLETKGTLDKISRRLQNSK